jgi:hypothetical protein
MILNRIGKESGGWAIRDILTQYSVSLFTTDVPDHRPKNIAFPLMEVSRAVDGGIEKGGRIPLKSRTGESSCGRNCA